MKPFFFLPLLAAPFVFGQQTSNRYIITNRCPSTIDIYVGNQKVGPLLNGRSITQAIPRFNGWIYTDANRGVASTRVGFFTDSAYYYIVKDPDYFNVGVSVSPVKPPTAGFCTPARCDTADCTDAYVGPPQRLPPPGKIAPRPPLHECFPPPGKFIDYAITFCPTGAFPPTQPTIKPVQIHPLLSKTKCLDVRAGIFAEGTPVQIYDCNGTPAQDWIVHEGKTTLQLGTVTGGVAWCLDGGANPVSGTGMKITKCSNAAAMQQWHYTKALGQINLDTKPGMCLDLTDGSLTNGKQTQTWQCAAGNKNQVWLVGDATSPVQPHHRIHPKGQPTKCLDVRAAVFANGTPVQIYDCNGTPAQDWDLVNGKTQIKIHDANFCLDAGTTPHDGVGLKIWQCYSNLAAQAWDIGTDGHVYLDGKGLCVDLTDGLLTNGKQSQIWTCAAGNRNQLWEID